MGRPDVLILRDPRESKKKCSLTPLRGMEGISFVDYAPERRIEGGGRVLLHTDGELLSEADAGRDLLLIDCSWRRVEPLLRTVQGEPVKRRLPPLQTAYPRKSKAFQDPDQGLASVEALFAALALMGASRPELLADYRWGEAFLEANSAALGLVR